MVQTPVAQGHVAGILEVPTLGGRDSDLGGQGEYCHMQQTLGCNIYFLSLVLTNILYFTSKSN